MITHSMVYAQYLREFYGARTVLVGGRPDMITHSMVYVQYLREVDPI